MAEEILVELFDESADPEEVDRLTRVIRQELLEIDEVDAVSQAAAGPAPEGTRGLTLAVIGALIVKAPAAIEAVGKVLDVVRSWLNRGAETSQKTMRLTVNGQTIELTPTKEQQQALIEEFLARVASAAPGSAPAT